MAKFWPIRAYPKPKGWRGYMIPPCYRFLRQNRRKTRSICILEGVKTMSRLKLEDIESKKFAVIFAPNTGGCFFIRKKCNETETLLFTGSEGLEDYKALKSVWRTNRVLFDTMCNEFTFEQLI